MVSCKKKETNYILYYQRANEIDSIYRLAGNPKLAAAEYKKLFSEYEPRNQERIEEYETYLKLADQNNIDFGGKESLNKLIPLIAQYGDYYKKYFPLFKKYGMDSLSVKQQISVWKKGLNQTLIDSFTIAMIRDKEQRHINLTIQAKNLKKNAKFLIWTFNKYGFPTTQKIGIMGHHNVLFTMPTFFTHMIESKEYYPVIKSRLFEYVKSGDCTPRDYAMMIDMYHLSLFNSSYYSSGPDIDSVEIDRNRKSIGLPSLKHASKIREDFKKKFN